jgi:hypothetical protein
MCRRDFEKNLFCEIASLLVAFHPVTWILKSQIAETQKVSAAVNIGCYAQ